MVMRPDTPPAPQPDDHAHGGAQQRESARISQSRRRILRAIPVAIVALLVLATAAATLALWPDQDRVVRSEETSGTGGTLVTARVSSIAPVSCAPAGSPAPTEAPATGDTETPATGEAGAPATGDAAAGADPTDCLAIRAQLPVGKPITVSVDALTAQHLALREGDSVRLITYEVDFGDGPETQYSYYDTPRAGKMLAVALVFALIVVFVGRWRGALSLVGVGAAITLLVTFILPAILAGKPPVPVAITGAIGIMVIVLYLAHGISHRTTAALFGSVFGILFTAGAGFAVTRWLRFTGIGSTEDASLAMAVPGLHMSDVLTATIVIAGLGILNDITVSQASAVWEMRALNPSLPKREIYQSAMRVGRDHIASSIYTLVFAYAGSMLVVLLLIYTYPRNLIDLVTTEQIGQEIVRTLIGAAGLVLAMPVTTALAVLFANEATAPPREPGAAPTPGAHIH